MSQQQQGQYNSNPYMGMNSNMDMNMGSNLNNGSTNNSMSTYSLPVPQNQASYPQMNAQGYQVSSSSQNYQSSSSVPTYQNTTSTQSYDITPSTQTYQNANTMPTYQTTSTAQNYQNQQINQTYQSPTPAPTYQNARATQNYQSARNYQNSANPNSQNYQAVAKSTNYMSQRAPSRSTTNNVQASNSNNIGYNMPNNSIPSSNLSSSVPQTNMTTSVSSMAHQSTSANPFNYTKPSSNLSTPKSPSPIPYNPSINPVAPISTSLKVNQSTNPIPIRTQVPQNTRAVPSTSVISNNPSQTQPNPTNTKADSPAATTIKPKPRTIGKNINHPTLLSKSPSRATPSKEKNASTPSSNNANFLSELRRSYRSIASSIIVTVRLAEHVSKGMKKYEGYKQQLKKLQQQQQTLNSPNLAADETKLKQHMAKHLNSISAEQKKLFEKCKIALANRASFQKKLSLLEQKELNLESDRLILEDCVRSASCCKSDASSLIVEDDSPGKSNSRKLSSLERFEKRRAKRQKEADTISLDA